MTELQQVSSSQALMHDMGITDENIARRLRFVGLEPKDLERIATIKDIVVREVDVFTAVFFDYLAGLDEARSLLGSRALLERAKSLKRDHIAAMAMGNYGTKYVEQRLELGLVYSKVGLDSRVFLGAFHHLLKAIGTTVMKQHEHAPMDGFESFMSLKKIAFFDVGLIVDVLVFEREKTIRQQQEAIRELSTPVLQTRDRLLLLPLIGVIDTVRARLITESLLHAVRANRAKVVVMDVTGVAMIDSKVANHLLQTVTAARLMGALVIVTGLSSDVAQSLVALGIDLDKVITVGDLQGGLEEAERILGYRTLRGQDDVDVRLPGRAVVEG